ncbi:MAG: hypothetical protein GY828_00495 [Candidatus Gracilibacteria bacterium]|nr:hypothetical protein [Candidatus Gracilibacteria bacterium]
MKDILKTYKKHKKLSNIGIIATSFVLAIGVNIFLIDGSQVGNSLKTSVLDVKHQVQNADIYAEKKESFVELFAGKDIQNIMSLTLSVAYNSNNVKFISQTTQQGEIIDLGISDTIQTFMIQYPDKISLHQGDLLLKLKTQKSSDSSEQLNILNANFLDTSGEIFHLTTSGITF